MKAFQSMSRFFHRLRVSQKLMLISVLFMIPDSVLLCLFLFSINSNIHFAEWEKSGNEYQRPLEELLEQLPEHLLLSRQTEGWTTAHGERLRAVESTIDQAFTRLEEVDARVGRRLQFTEEGLAKRKREHLRVATLKAEWMELRRRWESLTPEQRLDGQIHLIADVRGMITHVGDTSNLILDPDLDSYYLMDVTLLALPQAQDRLTSIIAYGEDVIRRGRITQEERSQLAVYAALLHESDLERIRASAATALNEDANFYGPSESLQRRLPAVLKDFGDAAVDFNALLNRLSREEAPDISLAAFQVAGAAARKASFALWRVADEELDGLLAARIDHFRGRRARSLILTGLALVAAVGFVTFITRSISGPLQRQAAELRATNQALEGEIQERKRAESALRTAEEKYRDIFENSVEGIFQTTESGSYVVVNSTLARIYGYDSVPELVEGIRDIAAGLYVDPNRRKEFQRQMAELGRVYRFESQIRRKDGEVIWISENARAVRDAGGALLYYEGTVEDITERKRSEAELERVHKKLVDASRMAGMAEVATGVLHNVGNVLNSVNVSANFVADTLRKSRLTNLSKVAGMLRENSSNLGEFLTRDPKGRQVAPYVCDLADHLLSENAEMVRKMDLLKQHLDHMKEVVAMQQSYAKVSGVAESVKVTELIEDAVRINASGLSRHQIEVDRQFDASPTMRVDKHRLLQILVNLVSNAKNACTDSGREEKRIRLRVRNGEGRVKIAVSDNGVGIPAENLVRIFNHGFTTRKEGHGFGLHSGALSAKEMGGSLRAHSEGPGLGATFTLELPTEHDYA